MTITAILYHLGLWGALGCAIFSLFVVVVFRTGLVWSARHEDGRLKKNVAWPGYLAMATIVLGIIGLQTLSTYVGWRYQAMELNFLQLFLLNYAYFGILFAYDTLVIDFLVLSLWRPGFLHIAQAMTAKSLKEHIRLSIPVGAVVGGILTAISTLLSYFTFLKG